jgi:hypothetical protein
MISLAGRSMDIRMKKRSVIVTEDMVEAGVFEYAKADDRFQSDEEIVTNIFVAMKLAASPVKRNSKASNNIHV